MNKKKRLKIIIPIISAAVIILLLSVLISNFCIEIKKYSVSESPETRIVFISDLHGRKFGKDNSRLIKKISKQEPDIICLVGDFIDEDNTHDDNEEFLSLVKKLLDIAPVYYSIGNHDLVYFNENGYDFADSLQNSGCVILDNDYVDLEINGASVRLGGIFEYAFNQKDLSKWVWQESDIYKFLSDFTATDSTTVLMCHRPDSFIYGNASLIWNIDTVLCGHTHGGLWRLPFIGGIIAPEQGFNPVFDKGEFTIGNIKMIISSGLAGYGKIPRLFNLPEITVIDI